MPAPRKTKSSGKLPLPAAAPRTLRIIGGALRGRHLNYSGDPRTRPMKDNIREAVFNLIGGWTPGKFAIDLFAGSGALGLEALSRGAVHALFIERHIDTARLISANVRELGLTSHSTIVEADTLFWGRNWSPAADPHAGHPWLVFCSPPYDLYVQEPDRLLELLARLLQLAPADSVFVVESDSRFDSRRLPQFDQWRIRAYQPAVIHVLRPTTNC